MRNFASALKKVDAVLLNPLPLSFPLGGFHFMVVSSSFSSPIFLSLDTIILPLLDDVLKGLLQLSLLGFVDEMLPADMVAEF